MLSLLKVAEGLMRIPTDHSCINPGRMFRVPGSVNCKNERHIQTEFLLVQEKAVVDLNLIERAGAVALKAKENKKESGAVPEVIPEGQRNKTLASIAGSLRHRGLDQKTIYESLRVVNAKCNPPLGDEEVARIAESIGRYEPKGSVGAHIQGGERSFVVVKASDVEPKPITWIWHQRIAKGKVSLLVGHPGQGKSFVSCAIAAAITKGHELPGHSGEIVSGDVLMFANEDGIPDTIRPRLDIVGADINRVDIVLVRNKTEKTRACLLRQTLDYLRNI